MFGTVNTVGQSLILVTRDYTDKITVKSICGASATSITGNVNLKAGNATLNFSGNNSAIIIWWNSKSVSVYDCGNYYNDYTFVKFLQEKQKIGITVMNGYKGFLFSDLPTDLSGAVSIIACRAVNQKEGRYSQGFISDSFGHRYTFVVDDNFSKVVFNKF